MRTLLAGVVEGPARNVLCEFVLQIVFCDNNPLRACEHLLRFWPIHVVPGGVLSSSMALSGVLLQAKPVRSSMATILENTKCVVLKFPIAGQERIVASAQLEQVISTNI